MGILAISGSLRVASTNTALLNAAVKLAPHNIDLLVYDRIG
jgi:chromate reductase, NAD(P)H dehydrogenase (quinone)